MVDPQWEALPRLELIPPAALPVFQALGISSLLLDHVWASIAAGEQARLKLMTSFDGRAVEVL
jgi:hypothetical protein